MFRNENLKILTPTADIGHRLWWYFNSDNDDVTTAGYFNNVSLAVSDTIQVTTASDYALYAVTNRVGNAKTVTEIVPFKAAEGIAITNREIAVKADEETLITDTDGVLMLCHPVPVEGTYTLKATVDSEGKATIAWVADE